MANTIMKIAEIGIYAMWHDGFTYGIKAGYAPGEVVLNQCSTVHS